MTRGIGILLILLVTSVVADCKGVEIVREESKDTYKLSDKIHVNEEVHNEMQKPLFAYELNELYKLCVVNDSINPEYENVLIMKKINGKFKKIGEFGFDSYGNNVMDTKNYKISKISVEHSKENSIVYVFRDGKLYEGVDILILNNENIEKKWIYRNKETPNLMFGHTMYKDLLNQQRTYIYNAKEMVINKFTQKLKNENRKVLYGEFLDDSHYIYVVTNQMDEQQENILIVYLNDNEIAERIFESGDLTKDGEPIKEINKVSINKLDNREKPNICVIRHNEKYTKVEMFQFYEKKTHRIGECRKDNKTGKYVGDERYRYVMNVSFPYDYCKESCD
jgi:hypothetical protein